VGWLERAGDRTLAFMTDPRQAPERSVTVRHATHDLPASTQSALTDGSCVCPELEVLIE
jgi:hypothetical protein